MRYFPSTNPLRAPFPSRTGHQPSGHPERLVPEVPATPTEAALWHQLLGPDEPPPWWARLLEQFRWLAFMGMLAYPEAPVAELDPRHSA
jgi:uncharacterized protein DUF6059